MRNLRLALAQINAIVGNLAGNSRKIIDCVKRASAADLVAFPELAISGYPPEDLLLKPSFIRSCRACLDEVATACRDIVAIVGFPGGYSCRWTTLQDATETRDGSAERFY